MKRSLFLHLLGAAPFATATPFTLPKRRRVHTRPLPEITVGIWAQDYYGLTYRCPVIGRRDGCRIVAWASVRYEDVAHLSRAQRQSLLRANLDATIAIVQAGLA